MMLLVLLIIGGAWVNLSNWLGGYNSALEGVDITAIRYVNTLEGQTYSASDTVDHWIYDRYVEKQYVPQGGDILITRNLPMKSKVALIVRLS